MRDNSLVSTLGIERLCRQIVGGQGTSRYNTFTDVYHEQDIHLQSASM